MRNPYERGDNRVNKDIQSREKKKTFKNAREGKMRLTALGDEWWPDLYLADEHTHESQGTPEIDTSA